MVRGRSLLQEIGIVVLLCAVAPASALARTSPPPVPACFSEVGICQGVPLKSAIGAVKLTSAPHGLFKLTGPAPLQTTEPVACGDLGCLFNHLDWIIGGGIVKKGCQTNTTSCEVQITPGADFWVPVVVNQNDFPKALFLLWTPAGAHTISGKITVRDCSDTCKLSPVPGVTVNAKGPDGSGSATTGSNGTYEISVPHGNGYEVTPSFKDVKFTPPHVRVDVTHDVKGVDFRAESPCEQSASDIAAAASDSNPCQRLYTLTLTAWLPYNSVADPYTGATVAAGNNYPIDSKSLFSSLSFGYLGTDAYPPCLGDQLIKTFTETRPDMTWRARFLGSGVRTIPASGGLGSVSVPIAWNGATDKAELRLTSVRPGTLQRQYDYNLQGSMGSCRQPITRQVTPTVRATITSDNSFAIDVSWPIPYQPYEDIADVKDFGDTLVAPLTKSAQKTLEDKLNQIPGYKGLPTYVKGKIKDYAVSIAERGGAAAAIATVKQALKNVVTFLANKTPPPIKYGKKALEILRKASYGSADLRIVGSFSTREPIPPLLAGSTTLRISSDGDAFPSFGVTVARPQGLVPWESNQSTTVTKTNFPDAYSGLPNVVNDAITETGPESNLQGGPSADVILRSLDTLRNITPPLIRPFVGPALVGNPTGTRMISFTFPGQRS